VLGHLGQHGHFGEDLGPNAGRERVLRHHVDSVAEEVFQILLDGNQVQQGAAIFERDEQVDVRPRIGFPSRAGTEEPEEIAPWARVTARMRARSSGGRSICYNHTGARLLQAWREQRRIQGPRNRHPRGLARHIDDVVRRAEGANVRELKRGRSAYWDEGTGTVVIRDPNHSDMGTAFRPPQGREVFSGLK
jgi:hypothetical protein